MNCCKGKLRIKFRVVEPETFRRRIWTVATPPGKESTYDPPATCRCSNCRRLRARHPKIISHPRISHGDCSDLEKIDMPKKDRRPKKASSTRRRGTRSRRPKKASTSKIELLPPYFDSQASAASSLAINIDIIREAKRCGCKAFRSGRVYSKPLLEWYEAWRAARAGNAAAPRDNGAGVPEQATPETRSDVQLRREKLDCERANFEFDVRKKKYLLTDQVMIAQGEMLVGLMTAFRRFPTDAARWIVGLRDYWEIVGKLRDELNAVLNIVHKAEFVSEAAIAELVDRPFAAELETLMANWSCEDRRRLVTSTAERILGEFGRSSLAPLLQRALPQTGETVADPEPASSTTAVTENKGGDS